MKPKDKNENAKSKDWQVPMKMPGVPKNKYDMSMATLGGTNPKMQKKSEAGKFNSAKEKGEL